MEVSHTQLDGTGFENRLALGVQGSTDAWRPWAVRLRYRYSDVDGLNQLSGLDGGGHRAKVRFQRTVGAWQLGLRYDFEHDSYSDDTLSLREHKIGVFG